jgi:hypothetical protein
MVIQGDTTNSKEVSMVLLKSNSDMQGMRELKQKGEQRHKNGPIIENNTVPNKRTNLCTFNIS